MSSYPFRLIWPHPAQTGFGLTGPVSAVAVAAGVSFAGLFCRFYDASLAARARQADRHLGPYLAMGGDLFAAGRRSEAFPAADSDR